MVEPNAASEQILQRLQQLEATAASAMDNALVVERSGGVTVRTPTNH